MHHLFDLHAFIVLRAKSRIIDKVAILGASQPQRVAKVVIWIIYEWFLLFRATYFEMHAPQSNRRPHRGRNIDRQKYFDGFESQCDFLLLDRLIIYLPTCLLSISFLTSRTRLFVFKIRCSSLNWTHVFQPLERKYSPLHLPSSFDF